MSRSSQPVAVAVELSSTGSTNVKPIVVAANTNTSSNPSNHKNNTVVKILLTFLILTLVSLIVAVILVPELNATVFGESDGSSSSAGGSSSLLEAVGTKSYSGSWGCNEWLLSSTKECDAYFDGVRLSTQDSVSPQDCLDWCSQKNKELGLEGVCKQTPSRDYTACTYCQASAVNYLSTDSYGRKIAICRAPSASAKTSRDCHFTGSCSCPQRNDGKSSDEFTAQEKESYAQQFVYAESSDTSGSGSCIMDSYEKGPIQVLSPSLGESWGVGCTTDLQIENWPRKPDGGYFSHAQLDIQKATYDTLSGKYKYFLSEASSIYKSKDKMREVVVNEGRRLLSGRGTRGRHLGAMATIRNVPLGRIGDKTFDGGTFRLTVTTCDACGTGSPWSSKCGYCDRVACDGSSFKFCPFHKEYCKDEPTCDVESSWGVSAPFTLSAKACGVTKSATGTSSKWKQTKSKYGGPYIDKGKSACWSLGITSC